MGKSTVHVEGSLECYFYDQVESVEGSHFERIGDDVKAYLIKMLAGFTRRTSVSGRSAPPLGMQYLEALRSGSPALREVGDRAQFIAGVMPKSVSGGAISLRYIVGIGKGAYAELAERHQNIPVFSRLSEGFSLHCELLSEVVEDASRLNSDEGLLEIYHRWREHGEQRDKRKLMMAGVQLETVGADQTQ